MKRWMLAEPAFIGAALLAAGSIITEQDLPVGIDPNDEDGEAEIRSDPPVSSIEINENGQAVRKKDRAAAAALGISVVEVAPVAPHAPNPTMPQSLPPHGVGEVLPAGTYVPADGAQGSAQELDAEMIAATAGSGPMGAAAAPAKVETAPKRRGS